MKVSPDRRTSPLCHFICGSTSSQNSSCILALILFLSVSDSLSLSPSPPPSQLPLPPCLSLSLLAILSLWLRQWCTPTPRPAAVQRGVEPAEAGSSSPGLVDASIAFLHHAGPGQEATSGCCQLIQSIRHRQLHLTPHVKVCIFMTQQQCGWIKGMSRMP